VTVAPFSVLAARHDPPLDDLALAIAAQFREVDVDAARARMDELGEEVAAAGGDPLEALVEVLGRRHGYLGEEDDYDDPANSMLDIVLERRRGLPIVLSIVYVEVARRAGLQLAGVGLPGHYVVGRFHPGPTILLDPFAGGERVFADDPEDVRPWGVHETALRMLNNLVGSYTRRNDLGRAIRAAEMRLELINAVEDAPAEALGAELRALRARLN
jgi:regulator of sirC expression with transglutaminase-like and TPR domain